MFIQRDDNAPVVVSITTTNAPGGNVIRYDKAYDLYTKTITFDNRYLKDTYKEWMEHCDLQAILGRTRWFATDVTSFARDFHELYSDEQTRYLLDCALADGFGVSYTKVKDSAIARSKWLSKIGFCEDLTKRQYPYKEVWLSWGYEDVNSGAHKETEEGEKE